MSIIYIWRRKTTKRQENRQIDQRNRVQRILYSESYVQDLIDSGEFQEEDEKGIDVPFYDLESIRDATNNFSDENKLGQGGYGPVYEGKLPSGQEIAVKRLSFVSGQGLQEFKNEVVLLQHRNLVRLWILHKRE
ncbi:G-type lectin S-receptor-like serine/threonine-protein kinase At4g03230 isoform X2 [Quercus lobata]|uniref:G-type lectin S-receptor-like serine/threonine-protein kinase At4g03230 isoform X2 n=1 Tax=Quercus lobata TaxID=97700 RepID=UPI0012444356|nr:G-type lectin S-receptor-like serine/threonine-protein kinase At4g03230 isoform X2 [Quercus lobata]